MLKSSRLVLITGSLIGLAVTMLPQTSRAVTIVQDEANVSATIDGILSLTATAHNTVGTADSTYTSSNNTYSATFNAASYSTNFANTTYQVTCNYLSSSTIEDVSGNTPSSCTNGWRVTATASDYNATSHEAQMVPANGSNAARIKSIKANALDGTNSNWLIKVTGTTRDGVTPTPYTNGSTINFANFEAIPLSTADNKSVVTGNTFNCSGSPTVCEYNGYQEFVVTYGFSAGAATPADTYTGTITYTLSVNAAS